MAPAHNDVVGDSYESQVASVFASWSLRCLSRRNVKRKGSFRWRNLQIR